MASNTITALIPKILLAQGLMVLRQNAVMPRLVRSMTSVIAGVRGSTLDVPVPSAITAVAVTPAATAAVAGALVPTTVPVALDQWYEAAFDMSDNEIEQAMDGVIPFVAEEAVKSIVNKVDQHLLGLYTNFFGYFGTAGTTPFGGSVLIADATGIRKVLNNQLAPLDPRHVVLNPDADANALSLEQFANMNFSGSVEAMRDGVLNRKLGMQWWMNQNIPTHTAGTAAGATTNAAGYAIGVTTITLASAGTGTILVGDVFTIAGQTQTYVVVTGDADVSNGGTVVFQPPLKVAIAASATAITLKASHVVNLAFHRDAIVFANRPLIPVAEGLGALSVSQIDPISGLALRIEVTREYKRTRWSYDMLWGANVVRRELGARLAG